MDLATCCCLEMAQGCSDWKIDKDLWRQAMSCVGRISKGSKGKSHFESTHSQTKRRSICYSAMGCHCIELLEEGYLNSLPALVTPSGNGSLLKGETVSLSALWRPKSRL